MALTMDGDVIEVTASDPVAVAARIRQLEEQIAGMPADAIDALSAEIGTVNSWLVGVLAKVTARARRLQQQGQKADPKKTVGQGRVGRPRRSQGGQTR